MASPTYPLQNGSFPSAKGEMPDKRRAHYPRCGFELGGYVPVLCRDCVDGIEIIRCARWACPHLHAHR